MSGGLLSGAAVYVVVDSMGEGFTRHSVHGVYSNGSLARLAAYHPHGSLTVLRFWLDAEPVDEAEEVAS